MKNYRVGYVTGGVVREIRKGAKRLGEAAKKHVARKEAAKVQAGKDEIRKSDMGYATGGITKISKILKQIKKGVVDRNVKSKEVKKLLEKSKARSKEKAGWGAHLKRRSRVFKEGQAKHKALDIKEGKKKKYIKRDPHEGVPSQSSDWPYWRGDE